ncbi:MAG: hypothetical protein K2X77_18310 [Candidatus Obscuribacterales bacterium]|jgi:hypothetical protein|nr:hypothetical protein [Candidatus Obscuribacterales bacterium]
MQNSKLLLLTVLALMSSTGNFPIEATEWKSISLYGEQHLSLASGSDDEAPSQQNHDEKGWQTLDLSPEAKKRKEAQKQGHQIQVPFTNELFFLLLIGFFSILVVRFRYWKKADGDKI